MYAYINGYVLALLEKHGTLYDLGFNKHKSEEADNSSPSIILHPPEHTSTHSPVLGTKGRSVF